MSNLIGGNCCRPQPRMRQQKIVIFDSPDGTGKTNISQALSLDLKVPYFRMATQHDNWRKGKFKEALEFDQTYIAEFLRQTKTSVIIDRAYPSEWVYSQVYKRETNMDVLDLVDAKFASMGAFIVIPVRRDYAKARADEVVENSMLPVLHEKYMEFRKWTRCKTITIYVDDFEDDLLKEMHVLKPELDFDTPLDGIMANANVTLAREITEKERLHDLFCKEKRPARYF